MPRRIKKPQSPGADEPVSIAVRQRRAAVERLQSGLGLLIVDGMGDFAERARVIEDFKHRRAGGRVGGSWFGVDNSMLQFVAINEALMIAVPVE